MNCIWCTVLYCTPSSEASAWSEIKQELPDLLSSANRTGSLVCSVRRNGKNLKQHIFAGDTDTVSQSVIMDDNGSLNFACTFLHVLTLWCRHRRICALSPDARGQQRRPSAWRRLSQPASRSHSRSRSQPPSSPDFSFLHRPAVSRRLHEPPAARAL